MPVTLMQLQDNIRKDNSLYLSFEEIEEGLIPELAQLIATSSEYKNIVLYRDLSKPNLLKTICNAMAKNQHIISFKVQALQNSNENKNNSQPKQKENRDNLSTLTNFFIPKPEQPVITVSTISEEKLFNTMK